MTTATAPHIPSDNEVKEQRGGTSWRIAKGKIVRGPKDNTIERDPQKIVGIVTRVGIHFGETNDSYKKPYGLIEAEITTANGSESVHASLIDSQTFDLKPSGSAVALGRALILLEGYAKDQLAKTGQPITPESLKAILAQTVVMFTASKGPDWTDDKGRSVEGTTYVNISIVTDGIARELQRPKRDKNAPKSSYMEQWQNEVKPAIEAHPLYAARPVREAQEDELTHLSDLTKTCTLLGWPTPEQAPAEWLKLASGAFPNMTPPTTLRDVSEDQWGEMRQLIDTNLGKNILGPDKAPGPVHEALLRMRASQPAAAAVVDQFA